jgi:hypothetical protein
VVLVAEMWEWVSMPGREMGEHVRTGLDLSLQQTGAKNIEVEGRDKADRCPTCTSCRVGRRQREPPATEPTTPLPALLPEVRGGVISRSPVRRSRAAAERAPPCGQQTWRASPRGQQLRGQRPRSWRRKPASTAGATRKSTSGTGEREMQGRA